MLLPLYAAFAAAMVFYLLIPVAGAFTLRNQWRRFRERVIALSRAPSLGYADLAAAEREGRWRSAAFASSGLSRRSRGRTGSGCEGSMSARLSTCRGAPLCSSAGATDAPTEAGSIARLSWRSVSSLVEGTSMFVAGLLSIEAGRPVFIDTPDESLIAVCYDGGDSGLLSRLVAGGRAPNEYWNLPTRISLAVGLAVISGILLLLNGSSSRAFVR